MASRFRRPLETQTLSNFNEDVFMEYPRRVITSRKARRVGKKVKFTAIVKKL